MKSCLPLLLLIAMAVGVFSGCSHDSSNVNLTGSAVISIEWPERTRFIPGSAESMQIVIKRGGRVCTTRICNRPAQGGRLNARFDDLPLGTVTYAVTAYPHADANGTPLGVANGVWQIVAYTDCTMDLWTEMDSTIDSLQITSATGEFMVVEGETLQLFVEARDAEGRVLCINNEQTRWSCGSGGDATTGYYGLVSGVCPGRISIDVYFPNLEKGTQVDITVMRPPWMQVLERPVQNIAYDAARGVLYATESYFQDLSAIDPNTGTVTALYPTVGSSSRMAVSPDQQFLYLHYYRTVSRFNLQQQAFDLTINVPEGITDLAVLPDDSHAIAVCSAGSVAIYDDDVLRTEVATVEPSIKHLLFGANSSELYAYADPSLSKICRLTVTAQGVTAGEVINKHLPYSNQLLYANGRIFLSEGSIIDPLTMEIVNRFPASGVCALNASGSRIYFLAEDETVSSYETWRRWRLRICDTTTRAVVDDLYIPEAHYMFRPSLIIPFGDDGLAICCDNDRLVIIHHAQLSRRTTHGGTR